MKRFFLTIFCILFALYCQSQTHSDQELLELSNLFSIDEMMFTSDTLSGAYHMPHRNVLNSYPFTHNNVLHISPNSVNGNHVLILVDNSIYNPLSSYIVRYAEDIHYANNIGVDIEVCSNGNYIEIKNLILFYNTNLIGCVFVGDIDVPYYEIDNDYGNEGYRSWPCDLFYMDLDGQWIDNDNNSIYDEHSGDVKPEIFVGRISSKNMGNLIPELQGLISFFNKDHKYWTGELDVPYRALAYNNKDWVDIPYFSNSIEHLFGINTIDTCNCHRCLDFSNDDYVQKNSSGLYGFIQLSAHSSPILHIFDCSINETLYSSTIYNTTNYSIGYNLFCCSACNWRASDSNEGFMGGAYLFNSPSCLFVVGSTKIGSLLSFDNFYSYLGNNDNVGLSLKKWWISTYGNTHSNSVISWHYGLSILGDPLVMLNNNNSDTCQDTITLSFFDTSNSSNLQIYRASNLISVGNNYQVPVGKHIILDAPNVNISPYFQCPLGASIEVRNNGCKQ